MSWFWLVVLAGFLWSAYSIPRVRAKLQRESGWADLYARYPCADWGEPNVRHKSAIIGDTPYNNVVDFHVDRTHLKVWFVRLFRAGALPIQIPWDDIVWHVEQAPLLGDRVVLRFRHVRGVRIKVHAPVAKLIAEKSGYNLLGTA